MLETVENECSDRNQLDMLCNHSDLRIFKVTIAVRCPTIDALQVIVASIATYAFLFEVAVVVLSLTRYDRNLKTTSNCENGALRVTTYDVCIKSVE